MRWEGRRPSTPEHALLGKLGEARDTTNPPETGLPLRSDLRLVQREEEVGAAELSKARVVASAGDPVETKHVPPLASAEKQGKGGRHGSGEEKGEEEFVAVPARRKGMGRVSRQR